MRSSRSSSRSSSAPGRRAGSCPGRPRQRTGRTVAVVGSGPAGLAAAAHLNRAGHEVTVYERDEGPGGLLRFGVPDFKLEKHYIDRRVAVLEAEGVIFEYGVDVGSSLSSEDLLERHDAAVLAIGSRVHRALDVPGADLQGVRFAMDYLYARNRFVARGEDPADDPELTAAGKHVVVIGGGDTAMDCVGNANREGAASVTVLDTYPAPPGPNARDSVPWPEAPRRLVTTYALDEGGERRWTQTATRLAGRDGRVTAVHGTYVTPPPGPQPVPGTEFELPADLVLVAIGFSHPEHTGAVEQLDARARPPRQCPRADLRDVASRGLRRGRRAHRPVADRQRDRRGPPLRAGRRPPPRGADPRLTIFWPTSGVRPPDLCLTAAKRRSIHPPDGFIGALRDVPWERKEGSAYGSTSGCAARGVRCPAGRPVDGGEPRRRC